MQSFKLFIEGKFLNSSSAVCGHCDDLLNPISLEENPKHIYNKGTMFSCKCRKSKIWTNSIRNEDNLASFLKKQCDRYYNGFCNDLFCGYCFHYVQNLQSGINYKGKHPFYSDDYPDIRERADQYGCEKCQQNQNILVWRRKFDPEEEKSTNKLIDFYRNFK